MALFCDFENIALGAREAKYATFDVSKVLERLLLKGNIVVKKAYCDWARYKEFKVDKYHLPVDWDEEERGELEAFIKDAYDRYHRCIARLEEKGYSRKRAKESARLYLPYGIQITCDIMFNWRSFAHFQKLRNDEHAQLEVREVAAEMLRLVEEQGDFPMTIEAMTAAGMLPVKENEE